MPVKTIRQLSGLMTDVSTLDAPEGALRQADNVLLHRPGIIQPRPGFGDTTGVASRTTDRRPVAMWPYAGDVIVQSYDGSSSWAIEKLSTDTQLDTTLEPFYPEIRSRSAAIESRGSLYITTSDGVYKYASPFDASLMRAGLWQTYARLRFSFLEPGADSERVAIEGDSIVAYRYVIKRVVNGYEIRSAPSSRQLMEVPASIYTDGVYVQFFADSYYLPADALEGDVIEIYRTRNSGSLDADPGEDYYLAVTYTVTSSDITNGFISSGTSGSIYDDVEDDQLGVALYASASQQGILASKDIPPACAHLVWWKGCAWAANLHERAVLTITLNKVVHDESATQRLEGQGLCFIDGGEWTGVSGDDLTGVTFTEGLGWDALAVGMWISDGIGPNSSAGGIQIGSRVLAFDENAQTITLDKTPTGSGTFEAGDVVEVDGISFYAFDTQSPAAGFFLVDQSSDEVSDRCHNTALNLAECISTIAAAQFGGGVNCYAIIDELLEGGQGTITLVSRYPGPGYNFDFQCITRPGAFTPDPSEALDAEADGESPVRLAGLRWSAPNEPEAWPLTQSATVGETGADILALVPMRDVLLVFKTDGLYRVTGVPPSSFAIDELDLSIRLLAAEATCVLDNVCYAWTDRGVISTDGYTVTRVSQPIDETLRAYQIAFPAYDSEEKRGVWMTSHHRLGLVILAVASSSDAELPAEEYVLHAESGRWSRWTRRDRCAVYDHAQDRMLVSPGIDEWSALYERVDGGTSGAAMYRDREVEFSGADVALDGTTLEIQDEVFGVHEPATCDLFQFDGTPIRVLSVARMRQDPQGGDDGWIIELAEEPTPGFTTVTWIQGYSCELLWHAQHAGGVGHRWGEMHAEMLSGAHEYLLEQPIAVGAAAHRDSAPSAVHPTIATNVTYSAPVRVGLPRACVRTPHLYPYLRICTAGFRWELAHIYLHHIQSSRRVR